MTTTTRRGRPPVTVPADVHAALLELSARAYAAREARPLTAATVGAALDAADSLEAAAGAVHRAHLPRRRGRLVVAGGGVYLQAPGGRVTTVHPAPAAAGGELEGGHPRGGCRLTPEGVG